MFFFQFESFLRIKTTTQHTLVYSNSNSSPSSAILSVREVESMIKSVKMQMFCLRCSYFGTDSE